MSVVHEVTLSCNADGCPRQITSQTVEQARRIARSEGWETEIMIPVSHRCHDLCPDHRRHRSLTLKPDGRLTLTDETGAASSWVVRNSVMTHTRAMERPYLVLTLEQGEDPGKVPHAMSRTVHCPACGHDHAAQHYVDTLNAKEGRS